MNTPLEIGRRWFNEVWNERNTALVPELMAEDAKGHLEGGQDVVGPAEFIAFQRVFLNLCPDLRVEILNTLADENDVCILWRATGTHAGEEMGLVATGRPVSFRGTTWFHIADGKISEGWDSWDRGTVIQKMSDPAVAAE